jgi:LDH2 family malate/lactate/ureidoglycolate dehydrogenase
MLPLGGEGSHFGGHKGYGLAVLVNALCGALSGSIYGIDPKDKVIFGKPLSTVANVGHFFGAIRIDGFRQKSEILHDMDLMLKALKESKTVRGEKRVYVAGEKSHMNEVDRKQNGIPLHQKTINELRDLGNKYELDCSFL